MHASRIVWSAWWSGHEALKDILVGLYPAMCQRCKGAYRENVQSELEKLAEWEKVGCQIGAWGGLCHGQVVW